MHAISIAYADLPPVALVAIFQLADLLDTPPHRAAKIYLQERAANTMRPHRH